MGIWLTIVHRKFSWTEVWFSLLTCMCLLQSLCAVEYDTEVCVWYIWKI